MLALLGPCRLVTPIFRLLVPGLISRFAIFYYVSNAESKPLPGFLPIKSPLTWHFILPLLRYSTSARLARFKSRHRD